MPFPFMAAAVIGSSLIGALSAERTNEKQTELAQTQMDFQRDMSNTAHQREVEDLRAAGLNPILSAKYGGSSTPSGAMPNLRNPLESFSSDVASASNVDMQKNLTLAQIENQNAQKKLNSAQAEKIENETNGVVLKNAIIAQELQEVIAKTRVRSGVWGSAVQVAKDLSEILRGVNSGGFIRNYEINY